MTPQATKHDEGKTKFSLVTPSFVSAVLNQHSPAHEIVFRLSLLSHAKNIEAFRAALCVVVDEVKTVMFNGSGVYMMEGAAKVLEFGCKKYSRNNWKRGFKFSRMIDAALRHTIQGGDTGDYPDDESGLPHKYHVCFCLMVLLDQLYEGSGEDDITIKDTGE